MAGIEDWVVLDEGFDLASAYFDTAALAAGKYEPKLELVRGEDGGRADLGDASLTRGALRVAFWDAVAMGCTARRRLGTRRREFGSGNDRDYPVLGIRPARESKKQ